MNKIQFIFDYTFYRIYKFFEERKDVAPDTKGALILSLMQFLTILDIIVVIRIGYHFPLPGKLYIFPLMALPAIINWFRYERNLNIESLELKWKSENQRRKIRNGWLISLYLLISFLIPAVSGYLEHNLKVI